MNEKPNMTDEELAKKLRQAFFKGYYVSMGQSIVTDPWDHLSPQDRAGYLEVALQARKLLAQPQSYEEKQYHPQDHLHLQYVKAVGLMSNLVGNMEIDSDDPVGMMKVVEKEFYRLQKMTKNPTQRPCCWVKTSERLPFDDNQRPVVYSGSPCVGCASWDKDSNMWVNLFTQARTDIPILWLDYPDPPKVEEKNCSYCGKPGHWRPDCDALAEDVKFDKWWRDQPDDSCTDYAKHWARVGWQASKGGER